MGLISKPILTSLIVILLVGVAPMPMQAQNVHVDGCATGPGNGSRSDPYKSLTRAVAAAAAGSNLIVEAGCYPDRLTISKNLTITASGGSVLVGEYYVGTQEICVPIIDQSCGLVSVLNCDADVINCAGDQPGVHAKLYYPAAAPSNASVACGGPFPLIVYAHGRRLQLWALCDWSNPDEDYREADGILAPLAASGFIVISVDVSGSLEYGKAQIILNALAYAQEENACPGSWLEGAVDMGRVGLAGHSTGGTAAVLAAEQLQLRFCDTNLHLDGVRATALALLAPGRFENEITRVNAAVLVIHGTNELPCEVGHLCQVGDDPLEIYELAVPPKHLVVVTGANHFGYTDAICITAPDDSPSEVGGVTGQEAHRRQQRAARNYVRAFFSHYLLNDATQLEYIMQESGEQCDNPGDPPGSPRRRFEDLDRLNVAVSVCSYVSSTIRPNFSGPSIYE